MNNIIVDIMPTSPDAAEFGSPWFEEALLKPDVVEMKNGRKITIIGPSYFLAAKLDAFFDRGNNDYIGSKDLEDIIALMEGCSRLVESVKNSSPALKKDVSTQLRRLLNAPAFMEAIPGHISPESYSQESTEHILRIASKIMEVGRTT